MMHDVLSDLAERIIKPAILRADYYWAALGKVIAPYMHYASEFGRRPLLPVSMSKNKCAIVKRVNLKHFGCEVPQPFQHALYCCVQEVLLVSPVYNKQVSHRIV
jgi:hypothetical protein